MRKFCLKGIFLIAASALAACVLYANPADDGRSPHRLGNQIYVSYDTPWNVSVKQGVRFYPECPDPEVKLDLYYPNEKCKEPKPYPCILVVHGGGWSMGNEKKFGLMASYLASRGYVVASTTYRLRPKYSMEDCAYDVKKSLSEKSAPMLILHSKNDPLVPLSESQNIKAAYEKYGAKCDMIVYDSGDHAFWNLRAYNPLQLRSWNDAANFFDKTLKK